MEKVRIGAKTFLYPMPTVLVGVNVGGKPNYVTIAYCGIAQHSPAMFSFSCGSTHFTAAGIKETGTFSVNIPSEEMVKVTDYCGMISGKSVDKGELFSTFYGKLENAPMIKECPLNLECRVVQAVDLGGNSELIIGEIVETYTTEQYLTNGLPDIRKIKPIIFTMHDNNYWQVGGHLGGAWNIGKDYKK
jgi:flavin reductase (DIM6/NTAB) family NADH-FMN oxidoreductase RutF